MCKFQVLGTGQKGICLGASGLLTTATNLHKYVDNGVLATHVVASVCSTSVIISKAAPVQPWLTRSPANHMVIGLILLGAELKIK